MHPELMKDLAGQYVLTRDGRLGCFDEQQQFQVDAGLTAALQEPIQRLLHACANGDSGEHARLGLIYRTHEQRPWKTATLFFDEKTVRHLYPVGAAHAPLTAFQRKNQERSVYRGMEILLGAGVKDAAATLYCPVLFDLDASLDHYLAVLGREPKPGDAQTPVIEVLNLVADLSPAQRDNPALQAMGNKLRTILIQRERKQSRQFTLIDTVRVEKPLSKGGYEMDARAARQITLDADDLDELHISERYDSVERWLEIPQRPVNSGDLRRFVHFGELNESCLEVLSARSLLYAAPAGTPLLDLGMTDKWNIFLLEGTVHLEAADNQSLIIEGGSLKASAPIALLKPRKYKVTSLSKISFLWIHDDLLLAVRDASRTQVLKIA